MSAQKQQVLACGHDARFGGVILLKGSCLACAYERQRDTTSDVITALKRIMRYANAGASVLDVNTREQPEFVNANRIIDSGAVSIGWTQQAEAALDAVAGSAAFTGLDESLQDQIHTLIEGTHYVD